MLKQSLNFRWLRLGRFSFSLSQVEYIFPQYLLGLGEGASQMPKTPKTKMKTWSNVTHCSMWWSLLLALVISTVLNCCDIIRMTVSPPRASFQGTQCVATALISREMGARTEYHAVLTPASRRLCAGPEWTLPPRRAHPQFPHSEVAFSSVQLLTSQLTNQSQEPATSCVLKGYVILDPLSKTHYWIP